MLPASPAQPPLPVPQTGRIQTLPMITAVPPAGRHARPPGHAPGGGRHRAATAARPSAVSRGLAGFPAAAAPLTTRWHGDRDRARDAGRHRIRPHRSLPGDRLAAGVATQTDPASTSAGGGAGAPQVAANAPPGTDAPARTAGLIRIRTSRWPALRPRAEDPAVSPD
jgi:hypothetical protein